MNHLKVFPTCRHKYLPHSLTSDTNTPDHRRLLFPAADLEDRDEDPHVSGGPGVSVDSNHSRLVRRSLTLFIQLRTG